MARRSFVRLLRKTVPRVWQLAAEIGLWRFARHFRQIVSRSRGMLGFNSRGATGSVSSTCRISVVNDSAWNGGRPVSMKKAVTPEE